MEAFTYEEAIRKIEELEPRGWRLGLDRMQAFCSFAGLDPWLGVGPRPNYIHIAGTNGKGSTTAFVESLLRAQGYRTGAFFSPYVIDYRERIQSSGAPISKEDLASSTELLFESVDAFGESEFGGITKFEFEAALGFLYWGKQNCEWVALEVGLGGRLDATNVVSSKCSIVVSIGLDHTAILGKTVELIAGEKAGIIKPGVPVIVGDMAPSALRVIENKAYEAGSPVWRFGREILLNEVAGSFDIQTPVGTHKALQPSLIGQKQPHNLALAVASIDACGLVLDEKAERFGALSTRAPGRFEQINVAGALFIVDGAHNADAARALLATLQTVHESRKPWVMVTNTIGGHDARSFYEVFSGSIRSVHIPPIHSPRAIDPEQSLNLAAPYFESAIAHLTLADAIKAARKEAGDQGLVLVTGSNYLAGEALSALLPNRNF
jgi:dihydrofolate synthase/folylpolyglutamate synthase